MTLRYCCLSNQGFGPICKVMEYEGQQCLGQFLLQFKRCWDKLLSYKGNTRESQLGYCKGATKDKEIAICCACSLIPWITYKRKVTHWSLVMTLGVQHSKVMTLGNDP